MAGCCVVDDDFMLVTRWLLDDVPADGDPLVRTVAKAFLHRSASTTAAKYDETSAGKGRVPDEAGEDAWRRGRDLRRAVVLRPALLERADAAGRAGQHGDPHTAFKFAENTGQMAPIREQAGTFADSIKPLWPPRTVPGL